MRIKTIIDWLNSIYEEHGYIKVKLNGEDISHFDLEDLFKVGHIDNEIMPILNINTEELDNE